MDKEVIVQEEKSNWKLMFMVVGGGIGLIAGLLAAFLVVKNSENQEENPSFSTGELFRIGMLVLVTISRITKLGND